MSEYYRQQLDAGQRYQDFVARGLYRCGFPLVNYQTRDFQLRHGENEFGLEIKFDRIFASSGKFWIEVGEKTHSTDERWRDSGILRDDNAWLYGIGDYNEFWIFGVEHLRRYYAKLPQAELLTNYRETSVGFLLSREVALRLALKTIDWRSVDGLEIDRPDAAPPTSAGAPLNLDTAEIER